MLLVAGLVLLVVGLVPLVDGVGSLDAGPVPLVAFLLSWLLV